MNRLVLTFSLLLVACPSDPPTDAGSDAALADAPAADAPIADAGASDAAGCACTAEQACLRGVCVARCDGVDALEAALAPGLVPVGHSCRVPGAFDAVGTNVYELESITNSDGSTTLRLVRWAGTDGDVSPTTLAARVYAPTADPAELVFPGFVTVSPDEQRAVFGYTTTLDGFVGGVVDVDTASMTFAEVSAPGNFDAAFVSNDVFLVNGLGFEALTGQALYRVDAAGGAAAVGGMGDASGSVVLWEEEDLVVFGGSNFGGPWPDGSTEIGYVFFLPAADVLSAAAAIDAYADAQRLVLPGAFEWLPGGRLAETVYGASGIDGIRVHPLSVSGGTVTAAAPVPLTTGGTFFAVGAIEGDALLVHAGGSLRVRLP
jgi:hypothetical protein